MPAKKTKTTVTKPRAVLVANERYGLYIGETAATDEEITSSRSVRLANCRHVCQWYGKTGGITSLAAHGPCGPRAQESRVGAPAKAALVTGVVNVFDLSAEAIAAFASIVPR
jgi:hypothetical protein